jgi:hypothetical protein
LCQSLLWKYFFDRYVHRCASWLICKWLDTMSVGHHLPLLKLCLKADLHTKGLATLQQIRCGILLLHIWSWFTLFLVVFWR